MSQPSEISRICAEKAPRLPAKRSAESAHREANLSIWHLNALFFLAIALRAAVAFHPYSGEKTPPVYGDFEAQRHWMEITVNLPARDWYRNTSDNDLTYWGLDYPPLSAYASLATAWFISIVDPAAVALHDSRGYETETFRAAMRLSVIMTDVLVFFPSLLLLLSIICRDRDRSDSHSFLWKMAMMRSLAFCLTLPALLMIDHAHFQYNNVSLGLFMASLACFLKQQDVLGSALFCACIYFKQMLLYYAPAIFCLLVGRLFQSLASRGVKSATMYAAKILASIAFTTCLAFAPWLTNSEMLLSVVRRLFPVSRGLYEDKVANVWCSISVLIKAKQWVSMENLVALCTIATIMSSLPFCVALVLKPSATRLLLAAFGCALSAFLFSFQVHEKQILIPLIPLAALHTKFPALSTWMSFAAVFSMFPLLLREGSGLAYLATIAIHASVVSFTATPPTNADVHEKKDARWVSIAASTSILAALCLNFALIFVAPPSFAPDIVVLLNTSFACAHFVGIYALSLRYIFYTEVLHPPEIDSTVT